MRTPSVSTIDLLAGQQRTPAGGPKAPEIAGRSRLTEGDLSAEPALVLLIRTDGALESRMRTTSAVSCPAS